MFSKHVWYDRRHQAEVFVDEQGVVTGTIVAYRGMVLAVNPRAEILKALYQEAKIRRILSLRGVILTSNDVAFTRGICALLNYSRALRRRSPLVIVTPESPKFPRDILGRCCLHLLAPAGFEAELVRLPVGASRRMGEGEIRFLEEGGSAGSRLEIASDRGRRLHLDDALLPEPPLVVPDPSGDRSGGTAGADLLVRAGSPAVQRVPTFTPLVDLTAS